MNETIYNVFYEIVDLWLTRSPNIRFFFFEGFPKEESFECSACCTMIVVCQFRQGEKVTKCPTFQGKLDSNNNMKQVQIMLIEHTCKFSIFGCDVEMKLDDINRHEEKCPNRSDLSLVPMLVARRK